MTDWGTKMAIFYWMMIGFTLIVLLCWAISRSNKSRRHGHRAAQLAQENHKLRNVIAHLSIDKYHPFE
jgi:hypothetical protein